MVTMQATEHSGERGEDGLRPVVYCLIPPDLAPRLHDLLRRHFAEQPGVEVIVERRRGERRAQADRRARSEAPPEERRRLRSAAGRRIGERRARLVAADPRELPRRARRYAERIAFVERLEPSSEHDEDLDTARRVVAFQSGDQEAFATLYTRYFDRVYAYLRVALKESHEAEDATQQVFTNAFEALPRYERRRQPFRAWLFTLAKNCALDHLRAQSRTEVVDPAELDRRRELESEPEPEMDVQLAALDWVNDPDLLVLIERLPVSQRQVLVLRYLMDMTGQQIADVLGRSPNEVRMLQHRAQRFLRERLTTLGLDPRRGRRIPWQTRVRQQVVLRERRFALFD